MQEAQVGWDPGLEYRLPLVFRIFIFYLLVILIISITRFCKLGWRLWHIRQMKIREEHAPEDLARSALSGQRLSRQSLVTPVDLAAIEFKLLWSQCRDTVDSTKRFVPLTLVYLGFVAFKYAAETSRMITEQKFVGFGLTYGALSELCVVIALGMLICLMILAPAIYFEGALARRATQWEYLLARQHETK